jgi:sugar phosphate isomerase/epimerase
MKIALDPYMIRHLPLSELPAAVAALGYDQIELSPRSDFLDWWVMPRATKERMVGFKAAMRSAGVGLASLQPMYRWASPFEDERQWGGRAPVGHALLEEGHRGGGGDGLPAHGLGVRTWVVARAIGR